MPIEEKRHASFESLDRAMSRAIHYSLRHFKALPSKQARIHRPSSRSKHGKGKSKDSDAQPHPGIAGMQEIRDLEHAHQSSGNWCPQAND